MVGFKHELKQVKMQNEILKQQLIDKNYVINDLNNERAKFTSSNVGRSQITGKSHFLKKKNLIFF